MRYQEVVAEAKKATRTGLGKIEFIACDTWLRGDQINLWTYWQGYQLKDIDENGVDILLVGLDWGAPENDKNEKTMASIRGIQAGKDVTYVATGPTDRTMAKMFTAFGNDVKIMKKDPGMRLFFTNYSLGYRGNGPESGGMTKTIMRQDEGLFHKLVLSIHPKIIICLGKITFELVSDTRVKGFVKQLHDGKPFKALYPLDNNIPVYGVAHCGARGRNNVGGEGNMMKAWMVIAEDYKQLI